MCHVVRSSSEFEPKYAALVNDPASCRYVSLNENLIAKHGFPLLWVLTREDREVPESIQSNASDHNPNITR